MKKNVSILLIVSCILIVFSLILFAEEVKFTFQNEPDGFRGLKWGDPPTEDMVYIAIMEGGLTFYKLPNEKLHIGDAWFYKISYSFFGSPERFMRVDLYY